MPRPGFSLFVEQAFTLYDRLLREPDLREVVRRCNSIMDQLDFYEPIDDDEEINIETARELFGELRTLAENRLKLGR